MRTTKETADQMLEISRFLKSKHSKHFHPTDFTKEIKEYVNISATPNEIKNPEFLCVLVENITEALPFLNIAIPLKTNEEHKQFCIQKLNEQKIDPKKPFYLVFQ